MLLASRAQDDAADAEYASFLTLCELAPHELVRVRMEAGPLPSIDLDEISGVIVGGSPFDTSSTRKSSTQVRVEREVSALLDEVVARDTPFFGACYGVGTLGVHQGAVVDATYGEEIGAVRVRLTAQGRSDPLLAELPEEFDAFVGHKEACSVLPASATLLVSSDTCPVQMFRVRSNLYATQFHPELDAAAIAARVRVYDGYGYYDPGELDEVLARIAASDVWAPSRILSAFVRRFART
ncbi:glutamine amidotransferase [Cellulomonas composti]|uniref:Glutamine amidotransferase n=1 Tax=Cellulomonas composti TaxID=266130 RepID=A0A511JBY3_9CELL|nr:glutamine amidotransferase [Cellulomonas composti]